MNQDDNKSAQEDQAWLAALSSKTDAGQAARLGRMLREVELADAAQEDTTHDWQRLQFALKREQAKGHTSYKYYALAATILIVVGTVTLLMPTREAAMQSPQEAASVMRGTSEQVILSANPAREAQQLEAELIQLGVKVTRSGSAEKISLKIQLTYPVKDEVRAALESRIIPVPERGELSVVFIRYSQSSK
jgi:hypothetical protein